MERFDGSACEYGFPLLRLRRNLKLNPRKLDEQHPPHREPSIADAPPTNARRSPPRKSDQSSACHFSNIISLYIKYLLYFPNSEILAPIVLQPFHMGRSERPISHSSTARAHCRPSRIAQTTKDWPRRISPAVKTPSSLVW